MKNGLEHISEERKRQQEDLKWTPENDDRYINNELGNAATAYLLANDLEIVSEDPMKNVTISVMMRRDMFWPFKDYSFKPSPEDRVKELAKAGALIAAEIDRINREPLINKKENNE